MSGSPEEMEVKMTPAAIADLSDAELKPVKKSVPVWIVILALVICLGAVYGAYSKGLQEPPPHIIKAKGS